MYFFQRFTRDYLNPQKKYCINSKLVSTKFAEMSKRTNFWSRIPSYGASFMLPNSETEPFFSEKQRNWFQKIVTHVLRLIWPHVHKKRCKKWLFFIRICCNPFQHWYTSLFSVEQFEKNLRLASKVFQSVVYSILPKYLMKTSIFEILFESSKNSLEYLHNSLVFQAEIFKAEFWALICSIK